jgi:hypothetical protein
MTKRNLNFNNSFNTLLDVSSDGFRGALVYRVQNLIGANSCMRFRNWGLVDITTHEGAPVSLGQSTITEFWSLMGQIVFNTFTASMSR